ncbi:MAG TPA: hypothetical protein VH044_12405 [Polyangiaceae bacterium]|jgi:hypothetical protein|nr:hypothetical protein [Polyangiaceae bacterium]
MNDREQDNDSLRADLLRQADDTRHKLVRTVERLDQRRHDVLDVRKQVARHLKGIGIGVALLVVAAAGASALVMHRVLTAVERRGRGGWRSRVRARAPRARPPAPPLAPRRSFTRDVLRSLAFTLVTTLLARPLRRVVGGAR